MEKFTIVAVDNYSDEIIIKDVEITDEDLLENDETVYEYLGEIVAEFQQGSLSTIVLNETQREILIKNFKV
jgi:hypothetical protein